MASYNPLSGLPSKKSNTRPGSFNPYFDPTTGTGANPNTQNTQGGFQGLPSYTAILQSDPVYQQTLADLGASNIADRAGLRSARQRAAIQFGEVPDFNALDQNFVGEGLGEDIDPTTRELAQKNTSEGLSVAARINKQHEDNVRQLTNYLASRGLLRSGEAGYQLGQEEQSYKTANYDAREKLIDYLSQYQQGYLSGIAKRQAAQQTAAGNAYTTGIQLYQNTPFGAPGGGGGGGGSQPAQGQSLYSQYVQPTLPTQPTNPLVSEEERRRLASAARFA